MVFTVGVLVSFLLYVIIGIILTRKIRNVEDYFVSGRNAPVILIAGSSVASLASTVIFMGDISFAYDGYALPLMVLAVLHGSGFVFGTFLFGRYLRRSRSLTLPEYFGKRFHSNRVRKATAITSILGITAYLMSVSQGVSLLLSQISGMPYSVAVIIATGVVVSFTFLSGAKGVLFTDTLMFFIFLVAVFISIPYIIHLAGGWPTAVINTAFLESKPDMLSWHGITGDGAFMGTPFEAIAWFVIMGIAWSIVGSVGPWQTSRYMMAKNEQVALRGGIVALISYAFMLIILHFGAAIISSINDAVDPSSHVYIWSAMNLMPVWMGVIVLSGIMAAGLSSASTFLQLIGNSVAYDLIDHSDRPRESLLKYSRAVMLIIGIVVLLLNLWQPPAIVWISYFAATLFAASWGPATFASVFSKKVNETGAFWSIIVGFLVVLITNFLDTFMGIAFPVYFDPVILGMISALITLILGIKFGGDVTAEEREFQNYILTPSEGQTQNDIAVTRKYANVLIVGGVVLVLFTFVFYFVPIHFM